ncbi:MAG: hypothetical protein LC749_02810 [Actinobacteria bacterium]|nr:hypothetical protein [Actinomycetota bacterium]
MPIRAAGAASTKPTRQRASYCRGLTLVEADDAAAGDVWVEHHLAVDLGQADVAEPLTAAVGLAGRRTVPLFLPVGWFLVVTAQVRFDRQRHAPVKGAWSILHVRGIQLAPGEYISIELEYSPLT